MTLPESWLYFDNFVTAWKQANMGKAFLNSFLVLLFVLLGSTLFSAMLAYVLNRFQFRGNKLIRNLFMISTLIPGIATQVIEILQEDVNRDDICSQHQDNVTVKRVD